MRLIFCIILYVTFINKVISLKCFYCAGSVTSDCYEGIRSSMVIQECSAAERNISTAKLPISDQGILEEEENDKVVTTCISFIAYTYGMTYIERSCGYIYEGVDICDYLDSVSEIVDCIHCEYDLCN